MATTPAMATLCFWPPDSLLGEWCRYFSILTAFRLSSTRCQISSVGTPMFFRPEAHVLFHYRTDNLIVRVLEHHARALAHVPEAVFVAGIHAVHPERAPRLA